MEKFKIYTDGSCNTKHRVGGWAAIVFYQNEKILLKGTVEQTNHNRMELQAVIEAVKYAQSVGESSDRLVVYSDSQYVVNIPQRMYKLAKNNFLTRKNTTIRNADMVKQLIHLIQTSNIVFTKVTAHLKKSASENYNREVDMISRKLVRDFIAHQKP